jgi:hypothetical protein
MPPMAWDSPGVIMHGKAAAPAAGRYCRPEAPSAPPIL